ncbi:MAG: hypothetical protein II056_02435 [Paludibacteraceae bacterium]|nr:hypothetical protein [Paludibacteraceae bacterium]
MNKDLWPEMRRQIFEEAKINVTTDTFEDVFKKIMDWLDSDSILVSAFVKYSFENGIKQLVDIKDFKIGKKVGLE